MTGFSDTDFARWAEANRQDLCHKPHWSTTGWGMARGMGRCAGRGLTRGTPTAVGRAVLKYVQADHFFAAAVAVDGLAVVAVAE